MATTGERGAVYGLGFVRGRERPEKWALELIARAVDRSRVRSIRKYVDQPPFDQGGLGSCTANAGCLSARAAANIDGVSVPILSREYMYEQERIFLGTWPQDSGADVLNEWDVDKEGNIADSVWPYDQNAAEQPPAAVAGATRYKTVAAFQPIQAGLQSTIDAILTALDNLQPVTIGLLWSNSFTVAYEQGSVVTPSMFTYMGEGHALDIIGWAPPSSAHPNGVFILQGSWGQASPPNTALWADAKSGDHYFDAALFTASYQGSPIVSDVYAVVPMAAPATLTCKVTPPSSAVAGQPSAWSAAVIGAPAGSVLSYTWAFSDGGGATGQAVSYTPKAAGQLTGTCTATVPTTGATASGSATVTVQPGPTPPTDCKALVDPVCVANQQAVIYEQAHDPSNKPVSRASTYKFAEDWLVYEQGQLDGVVTQGVTSAAPWPSIQDEDGAE